MEDSSKDLQRLEKYIRRLSKGEVAHEAEAQAVRGITLVNHHKGLLLCRFLVHHGVSDESGKWHEGAMATLMDTIASWTAFSFTSQDYITVYISISYYSKPNIQEVVEVEGKAIGKKGRMTSVRVEVRNKDDDGQMVASGKMWMAPAPSKVSAHKINKPVFSKL